MVGNEHSEGSPFFTGLDVLKRAAIIVAEGGEDICPWCAISTANDDFDDEHGTGLRGLDLILYWDTVVASDFPLRDAKEALLPWAADGKGCDDYSRPESMRILIQAINGWEG